MAKPRRKKTHAPREAVHLYLRGKSFYMEFRWKGVRYGPKSLGPVSREVAERQVAEMRLAVIEGSYHVRTAPGFATFAEEFLRSYTTGRRPSSVKRYTSGLMRMVRLWGYTPLDQITPRMIAQDQHARAQVCKPMTVNMDLEITRHLFTTAVRWKILAENPTTDIEEIPVDERSIHVLSYADEATLMSVCIPKLRRMLTFGIETGLRPGELTSLIWRQVDMQAKTVTVDSGRAKNRRMRVVPLTTLALESLPTRDLPDARVFGYREWQRTFRRAVVRAGLPAIITPHTLRHTFATRCLEAGVNIRRVQRWLGHASITMTERYTHPEEAYEREAIQRLERQTFQQSTRVDV